MKKIVKRISSIVLCLGMMSTLAACKPYDKPELVTIEASQTAFLIPLVGNTTEQASFESEELLAQAKVATKEIQIPHRWVKTGRSLLWIENGEWRPSAKLIVVERTPETREWSADKESGTSVKNQAIYAESKESIGFSAGMNCSAQIYSESDAVKFLYSYNNKTLEEIMDTEVRAKIESKFVEECAKYTLNEILANKEHIMDTVRGEVCNYFVDKGITITTLGLKDGFSYDDPTIQSAINEKFSSEQAIVAQQNRNEVTISKAKAEAEALMIAAEAEAAANEAISKSLTGNLIDKIKYEKWDGKLPTVSGSNAATLIDITG